MTKPVEPTVIKKYANRRLYNTGTSTYVTLEDLAEMVKSGEDFTVFDAKSNDDITHSVLTQIIFEQENKGQNLLPIQFLRQLIRFYGDSMQSVVPSYLEFSLNSLVREQEKFRQHVAQAFGQTAIDAMQDHARRNREMFEKAMRMFNPFANPAAFEANAGSAPNGGDAASGQTDQSARIDTPEEIDRLRQQMADMQRRLDALDADKGQGDKG